MPFDIHEPHDSEGGALLWSPDGTLTIRRTPAGYHVIAETYPVTPSPGAAAIPGAIIIFDAQQGDIENFLARLDEIAR